MKSKSRDFHLGDSLHPCKFDLSARLNCFRSCIPQVTSVLFLPQKNLGDMFFFYFQRAGRKFMYLPKCLMIYGDDRFIYGDIQKLPSSHNRFTEAVVLFMKIIKNAYLQIWIYRARPLKRSAFIKPFLEPSIYKQQLRLNTLTISRTISAHYQSQVHNEK